MPVSTSESMSSTMEDQSKPVTGYPTRYLPAQPNDQPAGYPPAQPRFPAYRYVAPPPAAYYNPNANDRRVNDTRRNFCIERFVPSVMFLCVLIFSLFFTWLLLRTRLPEFRVDSVSVTSFNFSDSQVTYNWDVDFFVGNPNWRTIFYSPMAASLYYREKFLTNTSLFPFNQEGRNQSRVKARFAASTVYVDGGVGKEIAEEKKRGAVKFNVKMMVRVAFDDSENLEMEGTLLKILCKDVNVEFWLNMGAGTLLGGSRKCKVNPASEL